MDNNLNRLLVNYYLHENQVLIVSRYTMQGILDVIDMEYGNPNPQRTSALRGKDYIIELLNDDRRCFEQFRMTRLVFIQLCDRLKTYGLQDTRYVSVPEQVSILLLSLSHNIRTRMNAERFQHSTETISRHFHSVLGKVLQLATEIIVPPDFSVTPKEIKRKKKFFPFFKNCVGAIDGTHIDAQIGVNQQAAFRGRKGHPTQNVMAVCSFDMKFTFVLAGWEGSANDSRILNACIASETLGFPKPPEDKYYVVDSGYANRQGFLAPYRGHRYHLQEFERSGINPMNKEEAFNYRHSALRNVIERCFGILKNRFSILRHMPGFQFETQVSIVTACCALHNFIRMQNEPDDLFDGTENDDVDINVEHMVQNPASSSQHNVMDTVRNQIADAIYLSTTRRREH